MRMARPARVLARSGTALCILLFVAFAASFAWHVDVFLGEWHAGLLCGSAHIVRDKTAPAGFWPLSCSGLRVQPIEWQSLDWLPRRIDTSQNQIEIVPMWIPFILVATPAAVFSYLDRRRPAPGACRACRYDLTGNTSGVCPECGEPVARTA